jgi:hypothetical protein
MERRTYSATNLPKKVDTEEEESEEDVQKKEARGSIMKFSCMNSTKVLVLCILCLQNSIFTILRRYSQGVLKENYSKVRGVTLRGWIFNVQYTAYSTQHSTVHSLYLTLSLLKIIA